MKRLTRVVTPVPLAVAPPIPFNAMSQPAPQPHTLIVRKAVKRTQDILEITLEDENGGVLHPFTAGAHIDIAIPTGITRSYSLLGDAADRTAYRIAVLRDAKSRGGSSWVHDNLQPGMQIGISVPVNHFPLVRDIAPIVILAGGIGITPFLSMLHDIARTHRERPVHLIYCARSRDTAAYVEDLANFQLADFTIQHHFDDETGRSPDIEKLMSQRDPRSHFYACGPTPMLDAFEKACASLKIDNWFLERFRGITNTVDVDTSSDAIIVLAKSGREIQASRGRSILACLRESGVEPDYSCEEGICGTCEVRILEGVAEHRDQYMTAQEQATGATVITCVSRCKSPRLVLDL